MIDLNFSDNKEACALKNSISKGAPEHGFFVSNMFDNVGCEPGSDGEGKIYEKDGGLSQVFITVVVIKFGYHVLQ
jgi:hypothetical protein